MNPMDLVQQVLVIAACAVVLAIPTAALVQGVRKWIPAVNGWLVVLLTGVFAALVVGLLSWPTTVDAARTSGLIALLAWGTAIGGDAWFAKMASKAKTVAILDAMPKPRDGDTDPAPPPFTREELPTRKEGK